MILWLFVGLFVLFFTGLPIALSLAFASTVFLWLNGSVPLTVVTQRMITGTDSFVLLAVPLFLLSGALMDNGGISKRLVSFANVLVGWATGGLSMIAVVASMIFAGISGSAAADCAAIGSIMIPAMIRKGYAKDFTTALQSCAGTIGVIIPPSVPMVVYGVIASTSIGALFIGGAIPGIIMGLALMGVSYVISKRRGYTGTARVSCGEALAAFRDAIWALIMPIIIVGGILGGVFTPTEAAGVATVYALLVGFFVYRELKLRDMPRLLKNAGVNTALVMFIISTASLFAWILASQQVPKAIAEAFLSFSDNPAVFLLMVNLLLLWVGTFLETTASLIIFAPVLLPVARQLHIDPIFLGVVMVVNLAIGMVTPPLGVSLFVGCSISGLRVERVIKPLIPFLVAMIVVLFLITYVPGLIMFLPGVFYVGR